MRAIPAPGDFVWCSVFSADWRTGNQTLVVRLAQWPATRVLRDLAQFIGTTETTFFVLEGRTLEMRWFAGPTEVPLCGHGALAVSDVIKPLLKAGERLRVRNVRKPLWVSAEPETAAVAFGATSVRRVATGRITIHVPVRAAFATTRDYLFVLDSERALRDMNRDAGDLKRLRKIGCIATARATGATAAFRFFAPRVGIIEDRASASVIPALVEYWGGGRDGRYRFLQLSGDPISIDACKRGSIVTVSGPVYQCARGALKVPELAAVTQLTGSLSVGSL